MDTRFWGPSGWKMLHLITFDYKYSPTNAISYAQFFDSIPYILPCKYCKSSLTDYYRQHPYKTYVNLNPSIDLKKWMYTIHNCVNDKLRQQGLNPNPNPSFKQVEEFYNKQVKCSWEEQLMLFWDFLFAVGYNHPKETIKYSSPMPDCPKDVYHCKDKCEKNKWNVLSVKDKKYWFTRFWSYLPVVLPIEIAKRWKEVENKNPSTLQCRRSTLAWLWRMRCGLDKHFKDPYTSICKKISSYSSDCGRNKRGITCRRIKEHKHMRKTAKK